MGHFLQLVQRVIMVKRITSALTLQRPVAVAVVGIAGLGEQALSGADEQARQVPVRIVAELPADRTVRLAPHRAVGVVLVRRQLMPIVPYFRQHVKRRVDELRHLPAHVGLPHLVAVAVVGQRQQRPSAGALADHAAHCVILVRVAHPVGDRALEQAVRGVFVKITLSAALFPPIQRRAVQVVPVLHRHAVPVGPADEPPLAVVVICLLFPGGVHDGGELSRAVIFILGGVPLAVGGGDHIPREVVGVPFCGAVRLHYAGNAPPLVQQVFDLISVAVHNAGDAAPGVVLQLLARPAHALDPPLGSGQVIFIPHAAAHTVQPLEQPAIGIVGVALQHMPVRAEPVLKQRFYKLQKDHSIFIVCTAFTNKAQKTIEIRTETT